MKHKIFALVALSVVAFGCLSPKTSGIVVEKGRLSIYDPSFATNLELEQDMMSRTPEGFLHAQVFVCNTNQRDFRCQYRFEWKNSQGMIQTHALSPWYPLVLHGRNTTALDAVAPLKEADDFRLVLRRAGE